MHRCSSGTTSSLRTTTRKRMCRLATLMCRFMLHCPVLLVSCVTNARFKRTLLVAMVTFVVLWLLLGRDSNQVGRYANWLHRPRSRPTPTTKYFIHGWTDDIYMYSAIANYHIPASGALNIIVTTLDASTKSLYCCVLLSNETLYLIRSREYFFYHSLTDVKFIEFIARIEEYFYPEVYKAHQFACVVPEIGQHASHVTLTSSTCSSDIRDYLPVTYPPRVPGGLALCAKIAYGGGRDPEQLIEWFELQRILGVDKVLIYDLGNPESLNRVFRYYQEIGFLDLQPYELPGNPVNRNLSRDHTSMQFHNDESMAVIECRQRMQGFSYVMSHDLDEFIIPRKNIGLKQFFEEKFKEYQDSAGFFFDTEFFIYNWGPANPEEDLVLTRFRKATKPQWERYKFVFLPHRTMSITTHSIFTVSPYTTYRISSDEAVLHHYRFCPDEWPTCFPETIIDNTMTRYHDLHNRVLKVRNITNTRPTWNSAQDYS